MNRIHMENIKNNKWVGENIIEIYKALAYKEMELIQLESSEELDKLYNTIESESF
jgi:hypothetical protein